MPARVPGKNEKALVERSMVIAIALATGALHYSFSGDKPPHIDEPRDIYAARQLIRDPMHPADYTLYWDGVAVPGSRQAVASTPVWPALLSIPMRAFGEKPAGLHLAMVPFTMLAVLAAGLIAGALGIPAIPAALFAGMSPVIAVYASGLMPDLPALAVALLALFCFIRAGGSARWGALGAALFITASFLKLSVLALLPVLVLASMRNGKLRPTTPWLAVALAGSLAWPAARLLMEPGMQEYYGAIPIWKGAWTLPALAPKGAFALATLAGAVVHPGIWIVLLGIRLGRARWWRTMIAAVLSLILLTLLRAGGAWQNLPSSAFSSTPGGINIPWFIGAGSAFLAWLIALAMEARGKAGATGRFLLAWLAFCIAGALSAPLISSRFILCAVPAVILLAVRDIHGLLPPRLRRLTLGALGAGTLWLAIGLVQADMRSAWAPVDLLNVAEKELAKSGLKGVLATDWGFQYQGLDRGFLLPARDPGALAPGRALVITESAPMHIKIPAGMEMREWLVLYSEAPDLPLRTMQPRSSAGFYGNGWLPYSFSTRPVEKISIARVVGNGGKR